MESHDGVGSHHEVYRKSFDCVLIKNEFSLSGTAKNRTSQGVGYGLFTVLE